MAEALKAAVESLDDSRGSWLTKLGEYLLKLREQRINQRYAEHQRRLREQDVVAIAMRQAAASFDKNK